MTPTWRIDAARPWLATTWRRFHLTNALYSATLHNDVFMRRRFLVTQPKVIPDTPDNASLVGLLGLTKTTAIGLGTYTGYKKRMHPEGRSAFWISSLTDWIRQFRRHQPRYVSL